MFSLNRRTFLIGSAAFAAVPKVAQAAPTFELRFGVAEPVGSATKLKCKMVHNSSTNSIFNEVYQGYLNGTNGIVRTTVPVRLLLKVHSAKGVRTGDKVAFRVNDLEEEHVATGTGFIPFECRSLAGKMQVVAIPRNIIDPHTYVELHAPDENLSWPCPGDPWGTAVNAMFHYDYVRPILIRRA